MPGIERERLVEWLLANGGAVVRYRTASELCGDFPRLEMRRLVRDLLAFAPVQQALAHLRVNGLAGELDHLNPRALDRLLAAVHGSGSTALENVLGRISEFGLHAGIPTLDERMLPLGRIFGDATNWREQGLDRWGRMQLVRGVFAWGLLRAGYKPDPHMQDYLTAQRLALYKTASQGIFDIYADEAELAELPKSWRGKPVLKPAVMAEYSLPLIHDLYVLAYQPDWMLDAEASQQVEEIVAYVLDSRFQSLTPGYGYAWVKERRTAYSWGWSPHLTDYQELQFEHEADNGQLVQQVELMARFPVARRSRWFQVALRRLEWFRTESGTYCFPSAYLRDQGSGYYVNGAGRSLCENRHHRLGLEVESTFRMLKILCSIGGLAENIEPVQL